jgi:hypothetical protein
MPTQHFCETAQGSSNAKWSQRPGIFVTGPRRFQTLSICQSEQWIPDTLAAVQPSPVGARDRAMQEAFGQFAPGIYSPTYLNESQFQQLRAQMRIVPNFKGSCAVVGSSSTLLKSTDGSLIDSADTVVRVNELPKLPHLYAAYTGKRTDVLVSHYARHVHNVSQLKSLPAVVFYCINKMFSSTCWNAVREDGMFRVCPRFVRRVRRSTGLLPWPSTGLIAFELANVMCDEVRAYGFGIDPLFSNCSHYYNVRQGDPSRCGMKGLQGRVRSSNPDHQLYLKDYYHNLKREAMLMRDHPFTRAPDARTHPRRITGKGALLRKRAAQHNKVLTPDGSAMPRLAQPN